MMPFDSGNVSHLKKFNGSYFMFDCELLVDSDPSSTPETGLDFWNRIQNEKESSVVSNICQNATIGESCSVHSSKEAALKPKPSAKGIRPNAVFISSPKAMLGLPFVDLPGSEVYATEATRRIGALLMQETVTLLQEAIAILGPQQQCHCLVTMRCSKLGSRKVENSESCAVATEVFVCKCQMLSLSMSHIHRTFSRVQGVRLGEVLKLGCGVTATAMATGGGEKEMGNCIWQLQSFDPLGNTEQETLTYWADSLEYGQTPYSTCLPVAEAAVACVANCGRALIPITAGSHVLKLLETIGDCVERKFGFQPPSYPLPLLVLYISPVAHQLLALCSSLPEWVSPQRQSRGYGNTCAFRTP